MDKTMTMKLFITTLCSLAIFSISEAQVWQTIHSNQFPGNDIQSNWWDGSKGTFEIDSSNNSIWLFRTDLITHISGNGIYSRHELASHPVLPSSDSYNSFCFKGGKVYVLDRNSGLYSYDGIGWVYENMYYFGTSLHVDQDTIWIGENDISTTVGKVVDGSLTNLDFSADLLVSRNGALWYTGSGTLYRYYSGPIGSWYNPDTCNLLGWVTGGMKFLPSSDSLFVATGNGFSIAYNDVFIDSINSSNTTGMPVNDILEFEFDSDENIWALFGNSSIEHTQLAYLNRTNMTWELVYDNTNSPLDWNGKMSFEIDSSDNVWVVDLAELHVLKFDPPPWLGTDKITNESIVIFPNPSSNILNILHLENSNSDYFKVLNLTGDIILEGSFNGKSIDISSISKGVYFLRIDEYFTTFVKE